MNKVVKVLFLTKYPEKGASSRYRVYQYLPFFKNINFKTQALQSDTSFKLMYRKGHFLKKVMYALKDYLFRTFFIFKNLDADVIYMQREIFAFGPLWAERLFKVLGKKLILDIDDALFINKINKNHPIKWDKATRVKRILSLVDIVNAGNTWIRDECLKLGAKSATNINVAESVKFENINTKTNSPLKVIWLGSPTTSEYLFLIEKPLKKIQDDLGIEINIIGSNENESYDFDYNRLSWSKEIEDHYLKISDIGLMPLPFEDWSKGKCGGKARTYMASGVIPVVSNIGYNKDLIKHRVSGFLCSDISDWVDAFYTLSNNLDLLTKIKKSNYLNVKSNFNSKQIAKQIENIIIDIYKVR
jgi:glycosyltransferase involved in cell wall biosynthesis